MEISGEINDITIFKSYDKLPKRIKIRTVKSEEDSTVIDKIELDIDKDGKIIHAFQN